MALSAKLHLTQSQLLAITPQLMQAIRLLQMSAAEVERFVEAEVEQNPLLDVSPPEHDGCAEEDNPLTADPDGGGDADGWSGSAIPDSVGAGSLPAFEWPRATSDVLGSSSAGSDFPFESMLTATESLCAGLERQIEAAFRDPGERAIALALLSGLDPAGYLTVDLAGLARRLGAEPNQVEAVVRRCQRFEPTGIFARSLAECLALQLAERDRLDPAMRALLTRLDLLAGRDLAALATHCGVGMEDLRDMIAEIQALDPKPGLSRSFDPLPALIPDVIVRRAPGAGWTVELNDAALPRLIVDRAYSAMVSDRLAGAADRKFMADCLQKAGWLEKCLDQRARTVLVVASEIVRRQAGFLQDGISRLRPLTLRTVADAVGLHESTVSRAVANKTVATPRGILEFKVFFSAAVQATTGGEAHSAESVKHRIRSLILGEDPADVLSDDTIVELLAREGIDIARRTVAKYREGMRIGSSVERRRKHRQGPPPERLHREVHRNAVGNLT